MAGVTIFDKFGDTADRLLKKFGTPSTVRRVTYPESNSEGKVTPTKEDFPVRAAQTRSVFKESDGTIKYRYTVVLKGKEVRIGDLMYWGSEWLEIKESEPVKPDGGTLIITRVGLDNVEGQSHDAPDEN